MPNLIHPISPTSYKFQTHGGAKGDDLRLLGNANACTKFQGNPSISC